MIHCTDRKLERAFVANVAVFPGELDAGRLAVRDLSESALQAVLAAVYGVLDEGGDWSTMRLEDAVRDRAGPDAVTLLRDLSGQVREVPIAGRVGAARERLARMAKARRVRDLMVRGVAACEELDVHAAVALAEAVTAEQDPEETPTGTLCEAGQSWLEGVINGEAENGQKYPRTGVGVLDTAMKGLRPGSLWVLAGRSGCRKSSLMLTAAMWQAQHGYRPHVVSLEDDDSVWGERAAGLAATGVGLRSCIEGVAKLDGIDVELSYPIDGRPSEVMETARAAAARGRWPIYVDYLQAASFDSGARRYDKEVAGLARSLKALARRYQIPLVLGSQLTTPKGRENKEPFPSDVRESGDVLSIAEILTLHWRTTDEENAPVLGRVAKLKWAASGQPFTLVIGENGGVSGASVGHPESQKELAQPGQDWYPA